MLVFVEAGTPKKPEWYARILPSDEFRRFVTDALAGERHEKAWIGTVFDFDENLIFTCDAAEKALGLLRGGCAVVTDTNMVLAGINKKVLAGFGGRALCFMADDDVARDARERGVTRAEASVDKAAGTVQPPLIYAVGNAPTALLRIAALRGTGSFRPDLVIAVPVGFVNVVEAKELCLGLDIPCIAARGRKGGSPAAAAIVNALLYSC